MGILSTIVVGGIAGGIAKLLLPGKNDPRGFFMTILVGIGGALLFTFVGRQLGWYSGDEAAGLIGAIIGSIALLLLYGAMQKRSPKR